MSLSTDKEILDFILKPESIALFGASNQPGKVGYVCLKNLQAAYHGKIYPIHPQEKEILGLPAFSSLDPIVEPVDLAFVVMPIMLHRSAMMREVSVAVRNAFHRCQREKKIQKPTYICWASSREYIPNMEILETGEVPCFEWPEQTSRDASLIYQYTQYRRSQE